MSIKLFVLSRNQPLKISYAKKKRGCKRMLTALGDSIWLIVNICVNRLYFHFEFATIFVRSHIRKMPYEFHVFPFTQCKNFGRITATFAMPVEEFAVPATIVCIGHHIPHFLNMILRRQKHFLAWTNQSSLSSGDYVFLKEAASGCTQPFSISSLVLYN